MEDMQRGEESTRAVAGIIVMAVLMVITIASYGVQQGLAQDAKSQLQSKAFPSSSKCKRCHERV